MLPQEDNGGPAYRVIGGVDIEPPAVEPSQPAPSFMNELGIFSPDLHTKQMFSTPFMQGKREEPRFRSGPELNEPRFL